MAISTCVRCGGTFFEMKEARIKDAAFRHYFVQCGGCGGVVGLIEFTNIGAQLEKLGKKLGVQL